MVIYYWEKVDMANKKQDKKRNDINEFYQENKVKLWVAFFEFILLSLVVIFALLPEPWRKYWYEDNGHFPWVGISVFIAAIGFIGNQIWERKKLNADIKSKSRIEWMVTVRDLLASYTTDSERLYSTMIDLANSVDTLYINKKDQMQEKKYISRSQKNKHFNLEKKFNDESQKQSVEYRKLLLYIPEARDNKTFLCKIKAVENEVESSRKKISCSVNAPTTIILKDLKCEIKCMKESISENGKLNNAIEEAISEGRIYFKREWERAKKGE